MDRHSTQKTLDIFQQFCCIIIATAVGADMTRPRNSTKTQYRQVRTADNRIGQSVSLVY